MINVLSWNLVMHVTAQDNTDHVHMLTVLACCLVTPIPVSKQQSYIKTSSLKYLGSENTSPFSLSLTDQLGYLATQYTLYTYAHLDMHTRYVCCVFQ